MLLPSNMTATKKSPPWSISRMPSVKPNATLNQPAWSVHGHHARLLVVIVGPTGVGKTELSIQLALRLNGEIISADSRLFYRGMDIGTAKPGQAERTVVPHHLIDVADPDQVWSLGRFQEAANQAIHAAHLAGHLPFLVGGTGQYIRAIVEGWTPPQVIPQPGLRSALEHWVEEITPQGLHDRLRILDEASAEQIDARNLRRTVRALEVIFTSGRRFSEQRRQGPAPYNTFTIGLFRPRVELYRRIDLRIQQMIDAGFENEVRSILNQGYSSELPCLSAIGYQEMIGHLSGKLSLDEAIALMKKRTRLYVRRQANWFKLDDPAIHWYDASIDIEDQIVADIQKWLERFYIQNE
jgi:tRNA dimethylallyltransferase